jgi:hypothetical protein
MRSQFTLFQYSPVCILRKYPIREIGDWPSSVVFPDDRRLLLCESIIGMAFTQAACQNIISTRDICVHLMAPELKLSLSRTAISDS